MYVLKKLGDVANNEEEEEEEVTTHTASTNTDPKIILINQPCNQGIFKHKKPFPPLVLILILIILDKPKQTGVHWRSYALLAWHT